MTAEDSGTAIFDLLSRHPGGLSRRGACAKADLTTGQWRRGRDYLRDLFGEETVIRTYVAGEWIYALASHGSERDSREYWDRLLRTQITRARREFNDAHGIAVSHPTLENEWQEEMARQRLSNLQFARRRFVQLELSEV